MEGLDEIYSSYPKGEWVDAVGLAAIFCAIWHTRMMFALKKIKSCTEMVL